MQIRSVVPLIGILLILAGCAPRYDFVGRDVKVLPQDRPPPSVTPVNLVDERLADAAKKASDALQRLAAIEQVRTPQADVPIIGVAPAELEQLITIDWVGPVEPIARRLADRAGYGFRTIGDAPTVPVIVTIYAVEERVVDVLRNIGFQAGGRAEVAVDAGLRMVEVRYDPVQGR